MKTLQTPSFSIFSSNTGEKVETLIHCFMETRTLERNSLPANICPADGIVYTCIYDTRIPEGVETFTAVISFQRHTFGNFAVIRIQKAKI